jgi:hypothetical protein
MNWFTLIATPANHLVDWFTANKLGMEIPVAVINIIRNIEPRPVMLVGGGMIQPLIGAEAMHVETFAAHAGGHTQLWVIPEATHCDGSFQRPVEYLEKMVGFSIPPLGTSNKKSGHARSVTRLICYAFFLFGRGMITNALARKQIVASI